MIALVLIQKRNCQAFPFSLDSESLSQLKIYIKIGLNEKKQKDSEKEQLVDF